MINKIEVIITSSVIGILLVISLVAIATSDRTGPVITVDENVKLSYTEGQDESVLLQGVKAYDKRDGDVTSSLMVESTIVKGNIIKVRYAAKDKHNNVTIAKKYREVSYTPGDGSKQPETQSQEETTAANEQPSEQETTAQEETTASQTVEITDEEKAASSSTGKPIIKLKQNELTIHAGDEFNKLDMVAGTYDETGDISRRIIIRGEVNTKEPGDYTLSYLVTNENRVPSDTVELVVHVK